MLVASLVGGVGCAPGGGVDAGADVDGGGAGGDDAGSGGDDAGAGGDDAGGDDDDGGAPVDDGGAPPVDGGAVAAVAGLRCDPAERVGLVEVEDSFGFVAAYATLFDRPAPWIGAPALVDAACAFYEHPAACSCPLGQECDTDGACVAAPVPVDGVVLVVRAGAASQTFDEEQGAGTVGGEITLGGTSFAIELRGLGVTVTTTATAIPAALDGATGSLTGTYDAPEAVDIAWTPPGGDSTVFTHVPMNHHVGAPTSTECAVASSTGALHIDGDMLVPLSVSTGLEFQGIDHARFAAAETAIGCVEIRFATSQYVDLG